MSPNQVPKALSYCFTLNNYTPDDIEDLKSKSDKYRYMVFGEEVAPTTGTPHLQGYVRLLKQMRMNQVHTLLNTRLSLAVAKGSPEQNYDYCSKEGVCIEIGERPLPNQVASAKTSKRCRDEKAMDMVRMLDSGSKYRDVFEKYPGDFLYCHRSLLSGFYLLNEEKHRPYVKCLMISGPTGCGKSRMAHEVLPCAYMKNSRTKWWHNYQLQEEVIIDDLGPNAIDITYFLNWLDRYKCNVETKGGMMPLYGTKFIITTNYCIDDLFCEEVVDYEQEFKHPIKVKKPLLQVKALNRRCPVLTFFEDEGPLCAGFSGVLDDVRLIRYKYPEAVDVVSHYFQDVARIADVGAGASCSVLEEEDSSENGEAVEV